MYLIKYKQKFSNRKISIKKSLEIIYNLEFTGFVKLERLWWWRNFIEYTTYQEITYPKQGFITVLRLNSTHKHPNTVRVLTKQQANSDKRELLVLNKLYGKEEEIYERKRNIKENWKNALKQEIC